MILMIDNYDSFTYNIVQYCLELDANLKVIRNDELSISQIKALNPEKIILSPGPATPDEAGVCLDVVKACEQPILGICLGHQAIAQAYGAKIIKAKNMMHGKTSTIEIVKDTKVFATLPKEFVATRYHSLVVDQDSVGGAIEVTSYSKDDHEIMSLQIKDKPVYGIQFHPESIMSEHGKTIIGNFLRI
ncbi:MAG: anthranilate synthase component II [Campylobacterota bacterium]